MPKIPMDYAKCSIYKIEHINAESLVYVGHTTNFDKRKTSHKSNCCNEKSKKHNQKLYQMIRQNGGWDEFKMIEVEKYSCNDKREAERRENEVMKDLKANMNTMKSFITENERKEWYEDNKERIQEYKKEWYEKNKPKIQEQMKEWYDTNKEKIKCECGCEVVKVKLKRHQQTKKHIEEIKNINV